MKWIKSIIENYKATKNENDPKEIIDEFSWGWISQNKAFVEKIQNEYSYFLNTWLDSRKKSPSEQFSALKSFIMYLEDVEKLCKTKGECFEFWYYEILTSRDYLERRKNDLRDLENNLVKLQTEYEKRSFEIVDLDSKIINTLKENDGMFQTDFVKLFDLSIQNDVKEKLYYMEKAGQLQRTKSGRTYILHYKN